MEAPFHALMVRLDHWERYCDFCTIFLHDCRLTDPESRMLRHHLVTVHGVDFRRVELLV